MLLTPYSEIKHEQNIFPVSCDGNDIDDDSKVLLGVTVWSKLKQAQQKWSSDDIDLWRSVKPNVIAKNGTAHFHSEGEVYSFGLNPRYDAINEMNILSYAPFVDSKCNQTQNNISVCLLALKTNTHIHYQLLHAEDTKTGRNQSPAVTKKLIMELQTCVDRVEACIENSTKMAGIVNIALEQCATQIRGETGNDPCVECLRVGGSGGKNTCSCTVHGNVNARTGDLHGERDCSGTLVGVPFQNIQSDEVDFIFQFMLNSGKTLSFALEENGSIFYNAFLLTHRQQRLRRSKSDFINILSYSPQRLYNNVKKSYLRCVKYCFCISICILLLNHFFCLRALNNSFRMG